MAEYKLSYESQLDAFHPSYRWESHDPSEDWKSKALRGPALPIFGNAVAGAVGSAVSNVVVYPLNVIVARLQTQQSNKNKANDTKDDDSTDDNEEAQSNIFEIAHKIYLQEGLAGFYPGLAQDTCKSVLDSFLFFLAYTIVRQRRIIARVGPARAARNKNIVLPILDELAIGVVAGSFSKLFTTPLANIVTRKQTAASKGGDSGQSTREIAARIRKEKGITGFWSGYSATLILALNPSITFFLNALLKRLLLPRSKRDKPSPAITFLLAALSKSAASSITYPFSLAKTRLQTMSSSNPGTTLKSSTLLSALMPRIITTVIAIARMEGISALYSGLQGEVLKGFFSHGFTMLAKDAVYGSIVKSYYMFLVLLRRYPSPEELIERAREQAEDQGGAEDALDNHSGGMAVDMTSNAATTMAAAAQDAKHGVDASSGFKVPPMPDEINETAELVGDYVEDEAAEWKSFYHWFWDKDRGHKE
ncbi:hypothetical protein N7528_001547 [Penicillium herquei]|nr:hypothetical protein N7528_001547 [Penicillium herquei]